MSLTPEQADLLIGVATHENITLMCFRNYSCLRPDQIQKGLESPVELVRSMAYKNPCCTDEQKVWYHLKWDAMNTPITDEKFDKLMYTYSSFEYIKPTQGEIDAFRDFSFTPEQIDLMILNFHCSGIVLVAKNLPLEPHQIGRLLSCWPSTILSGTTGIPIEIIDAALKSPSHFVVSMAYKHPSCTESMRVKHNLTCGHTL